MRKPTDTRLRDIEAAFEQTLADDPVYVDANEKGLSNLIAAQRYEPYEPAEPLAEGQPETGLASLLSPEEWQSLQEHPPNAQSATSPFKG